MPKSQFNLITLSLFQLGNDLKNSFKNICVALYFITYKYKIYKLVLGKFLFATSKIRAVQICAMENRGSRGMTVYTYMQI